ncbi:MAG: glycosyltransferase family 2 protein [Pyrinomonadaceae bacterium]|nr:glycosyltransferase family 2 protein [Pyrinomonadaceae bacterium]MBP6212805.1 glycosyltransferase family 2 protein [Pyrinomonadaceae bacterium]
MKPDLSIVVPAFNEQDRLGESLFRILEYVDSNKIRGELIVVDDGSSDSTADVAMKVMAKFPAVPSRLIRYEDNRGKGYAVRTGLQAAEADTALFSDADLSTPVDEMSKLIDPIRSGEFDVTFGSRAIDRSLIGTHQPWRREQGGRVMNLVIKTMSGLKFFDTQCGFKAFNMLKFGPLLERMTIDRFGFDVEFLFVAQRNGLRLAEIPVRWNDVAGSKVNVFRDTWRMFTELSEIRRNANSGAYDPK